jgi:hypothetical protein
MSELGCESRILGPSSQGKTLEIAFHGTHELEHGGEMNRYIQEKVAEHNPAGIIFNLLDYRYVSGNWEDSVLERKDLPIFRGLGRLKRIQPCYANRERNRITAFQ